MNEFKDFTTYFPLIAFLSIIFDFSMRSSLKVALLKEPENEAQLIQNNLTVIYATTALGLTVSLGFRLFFPGNKVADILSLLVLASSSFAALEAALSYLIGKRRIKLHSVIYGMRAALPMLIFLAISQFTQDFKYYLIACLSINVLSLLWLKKRIGFAFKPIFKMPSHLLAGVAILPATLSTYLLTYSDRFFLELQVEDSELIEYNLAYLSGTLLFPFCAVINRVTQAKMIRFTIESKLKPLFAMWVKIVPLYFIVSVVLVALSPTIIKLLGGGKYEPSFLMILLVCLGAFFYSLYTILLNSIIAGKNKIHFALPAIGAAVFNIGANFYFIPLYGGVGAAGTTLASYILEFGIAFFIVSREFKS